MFDFLSSNLSQMIKNRGMVFSVYLLFITSTFSMAGIEAATMLLIVFSLIHLISTKSWINLFESLNTVLNVEGNLEP